MDHVWRDYQGYIVMENNRPKRKLIFSDFWGMSSLVFMENYPHPSSLLELGVDGIRKVAKENKLWNNDKKKLFKI
jgi:transposase